MFSLLSDLLVDGPASPFYQTLIDSNMGSDYTPNTGLDIIIIISVCTNEKGSESGIDTYTKFFD